MRKIFTLLLILVFNNLLAQNNFELGYYIDESGNKIEGNISEIEISNFPEYFFYRKGNKTEEINVNSVNTIKYGTEVFEKKQFQYDPSIKLDIDKMSKNKELNLVSKTAFLQLLVNGNYKLYKYVENGVTTFFYEDDSNKLTTLKYKKYLLNNTDIDENKEYLNQLSQNINSGTKQVEGYYSTIKYNDNDLKEYFTKINGNSVKVERKSKVKFNIFAGYFLHSMDINFITDVPAENYGHFSIMPEIEYVLDQNKINPTSFYFNAKFHSFKKEFVEKVVRDDWHHKVNYQSIYVSFGVKKYFLSSENIQFYGKLGVGLNNPVKHEIEMPLDAWRVKPIYLSHFGGGISPGIGAKFFDSFLVEVDYDYIFNTLFINKNTSLNFKVGYSF